MNTRESRGGAGNRKGLRATGRLINVDELRQAGPSARWICCQLGAREHYAIPLALSGAGALDHLATDVWVRRASPLRGLPFSRWRDRYAPGVDDGCVACWNLQAAGFELESRWRGASGWALILERNKWFQDRVLRFLEKTSRGNAAHGQPRILFSYSYTASDLFEYAKTLGWKLILGQIDPGPEEERIVANLHAASAHPKGAWRPAPAAYWTAWRRECELADRIIVNSEWSRIALNRAGIAAGKVDVIPLSYRPPRESVQFEREVPAKFSQERPLRLLFLGQVNLRKGIGVLFEAMRRLKRMPVEFWIVGPVSDLIPSELRRQKNIWWRGSVARRHTSWYYRHADLFVFPTFSDGFGLTQLEAQAWKLPAIVSRFCGEVIEDRVNGIVLSDVTPDTLCTSIESCLEQPSRLFEMSRASNIRRFRLEALSRRLSDLGSSLADSRYPATAANA